MAARRPRVVILVENLPVPLDRRVWLEARALHHAGWDVVVICPTGRGARRLRDRIDGIEVLRYPQFVASGLLGYVAEYIPSMLFTAAWFLWARIRGPIDVVHGSNPPDLFWVFGRLAQLWGGRFVFDQHDPNPELSLAKFGDRGLKGRLIQRLTRLLERFSYRTADLVIAVNDTCRDLALQRGRLHPDEVIIVRNAPSLASHAAQVEGIVPEGRGVGYVGVMGLHDGLDLLIDAWAIVAAAPDLGDARLELVGDGPARKGIEAAVARLGLESSVTFWGYRPAREYLPLLARCRVGVSPDPPTAFNDLSSMVKVIDYLSIGRGAVSYDLPETRRIGGPGLEVAAEATPAALAAALMAVLRDGDAAARLGAAGQAHVRSLGLDWPRNARALVDAYERLRPA